MRNAQVSRPGPRKSFWIALAVTIVAVLSVVSRTHAQSTTSLSKSQAVEALTLKLLDLNAQYRQANSAGKTQLLSQMQTAAASRLQMLTSLADGNPGEVLRASLSAKLRALMPSGLQNYLEKDTVAQGIYEVSVEMDGTPDKTTNIKMRYGLMTAAGKLKLHFASNPPEKLLTGSVVRVHGTQVGNDLVLASGNPKNNTSTSSTQVVSSASAPSSTGAVSTLVILVNFQDTPTAQPWTPATVQNMIFTQLSNWDLENSFQQTWLTGDVAGWYTVGVSSTNCDTSTIKSDALSAAQAAGYNLSSYAHYIYLMSSNTGCSAWWGLASIGGSDVWVNGQYNIAVHVFAHEMGHNFGLYHAHTVDCGTQVTCSSGTTAEYGDSFDVMGSSTYNAPEYDAFHKEQLGWLNSGTHPPITTVTSSGTYTISPYEAQDSNTKALKILQSGSTDSYYYVEFRQALGFDSYLSSYTDLMGGTMFHLASPSNANSSDLLDMTPTSPSSFTHPALVAGQTYTDATAGVSVTPVSVSSTGATVQVTVGAPACSNANPTVNVSPSQSQYVTSGTPVAFTVSVRDNDSSNCAGATFDLSSTLPSGWSGAWSNSALSLAPGGSGSATVTVTSPAGTANGFYTVGVGAANASDANYSGSASATYAISAALTPTVSVSTGQSSYMPGQTVTINVNVLAGGSADPGASVSVTVTASNGNTSSLTGTTGSNGTVSLSYKLSKRAAAGTYQAIASASSASASTTFVVQ